MCHTHLFCCRLYSLFLSLRFFPFMSFPLRTIAFILLHSPALPYLRYLQLIFSFIADLSYLCLHSLTFAFLCSFPSFFYACITDIDPDMGSLNAVPGSHHNFVDGIGHGNVSCHIGV